MSYQTPIVKSGLRVKDKVKFTTHTFYPFNQDSILTVAQLGDRDAILVSDGVNDKWTDVYCVVKITTDEVDRLS